MDKFLTRAIHNYWRVSACWNLGKGKITVSEAFELLNKAEYWALYGGNHKLARNISALRDQIIRFQSPLKAPEKALEAH